MTRLDEAAKALAGQGIMILRISAIVPSMDGEETARMVERLKLILEALRPREANVPVQQYFDRLIGEK